jgi:hypothetical protein
MAKTIKQLKRQIMRRVYYTYTLRIVTDPVNVYPFLMGVSLVLMTQFVSFTNVAQNLLAIEVGRIPVWAFNAVTSTEAPTLLLLGIMIFAALSLRLKLRLPKAQLAHAV